MFKTYESIPITIEAVQFTNENKDQVFNSLTGNYYPDFENGNPILKVMTVYGEIAIIRIGDWLVKDKYPIRDDIFKSQNV